MEKYNTMKAMTIALPNLRQLSLNNLGLGGGGHKYSDGEDPKAFANWATHDIGIISIFKNMCSLEVKNSSLND